MLFKIELWHAKSKHNLRCSEVFSNDFEEKRKLIERGLKNPESCGKIARRELTTPIMELSDVTVFTPGQTVRTSGRVFILSTAELVKRIKTRYATRSGRNEFPDIVDEYLAGKNVSLNGLSNADSRNATEDLRGLSYVYRNGQGLAVVAEIEPNIVPVRDYSVNDGFPTTVPLKEFNLPGIINGQGYLYSIGSSSGPYRDKLMNFDIIVKGVNNDIATMPRGKNYSKYADALSVIGIILVLVGAWGMAAKGKLWEIGLPALVLGGILLYLRFLSPWGVEKFSAPPEEIEGNSSLIVDAIGDDD
ncbi:MAG: hypothetical protein WC520_04185 [Candidatus Paceibacterota bacterium]